MKHPAFPVVMKNALLIVKPTQMEIDHPEHEIAFVVATGRTLTRFAVEFEDQGNGSSEITISAAHGRNHLVRIRFRGSEYSLHLAKGGFDIHSIEDAETVSDGVVLINRRGWEQLEAGCYLTAIPPELVTVHVVPPEPRGPKRLLSLVATWTPVVGSRYTLAPNKGG